MCLKFEFPRLKQRRLYDLLKEDAREASVYFFDESSELKLLCLKFGDEETAFVA